MSLTKEQQIAADWLAWLNYRVDGLPKIYDEARDSLAELLAAQHSVQADGAKCLVCGEVVLLSCSHHNGAVVSPPRR